MFDLHCHYLPGVDDGAETLDQGLQLAAAAVANGIEGAILTPHVHPGRYANTRSALQPHFKVFSRALADAGIPLQIRLGCELRLSADSIELLALGEVPMLGFWNSQPVLLLEFPHETVPVGALQAVEHLRTRGYLPMIAHPERNKTLIRDPLRLRSFIEAGCLAQLTAASVCGHFGPPPLRAALAMIEQGWITLVASDAHNLTHRPPVMAEAREALATRYGPDVAHRLTVESPGAIFRSAICESSTTGL
jgi:protein-tyrosine phosphatase